MASVRKLSSSLSPVSLSGPVGPLLAARGALRGQPRDGGGAGPDQAARESLPLRTGLRVPPWPPSHPSHAPCQARPGASPCWCLRCPRLPRLQRHTRPGPAGAGRWRHFRPLTPVPNVASGTAPRAGAWAQPPRLWEASLVLGQFSGLAFSRSHSRPRRSAPRLPVPGATLHFMIRSESSPRGRPVQASASRLLRGVEPPWYSEARVCPVLAPCEGTGGSGTRLLPICGWASLCPCARCARHTGLFP